MSWNFGILASAAAVILAGCSGGMSASDKEAMLMSKEAEYMQKSCESLFAKLGSMEKKETHLMSAQEEEEDGDEESLMQKAQSALAFLRRSDEAVAEELSMLKDDKKALKKALKANGCSDS